MYLSNLLHMFAKSVTSICQLCYMYLSTLLHVFVKVDFGCSAREICSGQALVVVGAVTLVLLLRPGAAVGRRLLRGTLRSVRESLPSARF